MAGPVLVRIDGLPGLYRRSEVRYLYYTPLNQYMRASGQETMKEARRLTPWGKRHKEGTARMRNSWSVQYEGNEPITKYTLINDAPWAEAVVKGTRAHPIFPRHPKEALWWPGLPRPRGAVHKHPGATPNDIERKARDAAAGEIHGRLQREFDAEVERRWEGLGESR